MAHYHQLNPELTNDDINSWFSLARSADSIQSPVACVTYKGKCYNPHPNKDQQQEIRKFNHPMYEDNEESICDMVSATSIGGDMFQLDAESMPPPLMEKMKDEDNGCLEIYKHYNFSHKYNPDLPITSYHQTILETINGYSVTVLQGSTGSGKTTQVPQLILDAHAKMEKYCNIVITQPRKIAALSLAHRVCHERNWQIGQVVGYQVGLEKMTSQDTRLTFVTTGVLLHQLIKAKNLNKFTHIILDEVHERDQETDFAMLLVRKLLWLNSKSVKVILMSATLNSHQIAEYFGYHVNGNFSLAPTICIKGRLFNVLEHYAEDLTSLGSLPKLDVANPEISDEVYTLASRLILHLDVLETENQIDKKQRGSVLVFLPGIFQIREFENILECERLKRKLKIIPLHSSITSEEQAEVFITPQNGFRKVILSTNIAESSITVPDVVYVVDFCLTKCMVCDMDTNYQSLRVQWASKANAKQRAGRAGRVSCGQVYRLVSRFFWDTCIPEYGIPELQRCSLESAVLKVKILDLGAPKAILSLAMSPPDLQNIECTILLLKEIGALSTTTNLKRFDGDLTFVGQVLASLPIDMRLGKMLMLGLVFGCLENCLVIAASLSKQSFFATPYNKLLEAYRHQLMWSNGSFSDCIALLTAYREWETLTTSQQFRRKRDEKLWARKNFVQLRRLHEVHFLVEELRDRLKHFNIRSNDACYWDSEDSQQTQLILKVVMAGAFYPNYFVQSLPDEAQSIKEMSMLNPSTTVVVSGLPSGSGPLFKESLTEMTKDCGQQKALYYDGCKAFIEFIPDTVINTGNVISSVYMACKIRQIRRPLQLKQTIQDDSRSTSLMTESPFLCDTLVMPMFAAEVPQPGNMVYFNICITHINSAVRFWGYKCMRKNIETLHHISTLIEECSKVSTNCLKESSLVLAPYDDGLLEHYYRAIIVATDPVIKVWFVDYGNIETISSSAVLYKIPNELCKIGFQAIQFQLHGIEVKETSSERKAKQFFQGLIQASENKVKVKVYSVVSNVVHVDLFCNGTRHVNQLLVTQNFCKNAPEGKLSEINHLLWDQAVQHQSSSAFKKEINREWMEVDSSSSNRMKHSDKVTVQGPRTTFETSFFSITNIGRLRSVNIDRSGVNSVSIHQDPKNLNRCMLIAAQVGINQSGSTMLARNTTIMPPIKGLLPLLCLIFAPVVEFRVDANFTRYTGAICGLGSMTNRNGCFSILPDHDIEVMFDFNLSLQDIIDINGLRMMINIAVGGTESINSWSQKMVHRIQTNARQKLFSILTKPRTAADPTPSSRPYRWKIISEERTVPHQVSNKQADRKDLYRLHDAVAMQNVQNVYEIKDHP
uniref:RNA helicase n=1 Tax=Phallusia mammillata TaxID=59560 RepID=A0A6F9DVI1_9ASCI|nr:putative ATP-dependent RNA helicase TDRD9 [Phallusia mammillata]